MSQYKLGSLFDGSGGFPLAGSLCGIEPVWAAEIEPYPIAVTRSRFPGMKHLGDVSKINGADIEPVDIICAGSPCQDLSTAGLRKGLKHESNGDGETTRSGLFMEFIRIIKEMRRATNGKYPRFALWENVPGAFSSNKGEDFKVVCEEIIKIVEPSAVMPSVPQKGWSYADSYVGDGWSLAYRVLDAQYWGVPQRRRRIYLVADFRGESAREVLFERQGLRGYFTQGKTPWQGAASNAQEGAGANDRARECLIYTRGFGGNVKANGATPTLEARAGTGGNNQPIVAYSLEKQQQAQPVICLQGNGIDRPDTATCNGKGWKENASYTLNTVDRPAVAYSAGFCPEQSAKTRGIGYEEGRAPTLRAGVTPGVAYQTPPSHVVRRITPTECARLQGFADQHGHLEKKRKLTDDECRFWAEVRNTHAAVNGKKVQDYTEKQLLAWYNKLWTDTAEYKMWGNGIALPTALYVMQGIGDALAADAIEDWML